MKPLLLSACCAVLLHTGVVMATPGCPPHYQQINDSNALLVLGGTATGPVKQVVVGEFGKDVDRQKRMLAKFDACGVLLQANISVDKNEGNVVMKAVQSITRVEDGWQTAYDISVFVIRAGEVEPVTRKEGIISYMTGRNGTITSSTDTFLLQGVKGFTATTNSFDARFRLIKSVARGSDSLANGESIYQWNKKNQLTSSFSGSNRMFLRYDSQDRELMLRTLTTSPLSQLHTVDECQLWDDRGNCTLSYSRETELFPAGMIRRDITTAYRFEYWDKAGRAEEDDRTFP